jgi:hypothetical protein
VARSPAKYGRDLHRPVVANAINTIESTIKQSVSQSTKLQLHSIQRATAILHRLHTHTHLLHFRNHLKVITNLLEGLDLIQNLEYHSSLGKVDQITNHFRIAIFDKCQVLQIDAPGDDIVNRLANSTCKQQAACAFALSLSLSLSLSHSLNIHVWYARRLDSFDCISIHLVGCLHIGKCLDLVQRSLCLFGQSRFRPLQAQNRRCIESGNERQHQMVAVQLHARL